MEFFSSLWDQQIALSRDIVISDDTGEGGEQKKTSMTCFTERKYVLAQSMLINSLWSCENMWRDAYKSVE